MWLMICKMQQHFCVCKVKLRTNLLARTWCNCKTSTPLTSYYKRCTPLHETNRLNKNKNMINIYNKVEDKYKIKMMTDSNCGSRSSSRDLWSIILLARCKVHERVCTMSCHCNGHNLLTHFLRQSITSTPTYTICTNSCNSM